MNARQKERHKSQKDKLDDLSYLITHTITCFATDAPSLLAQSWVQTHFSAFKEDGKFGLQINLNAQAKDGEPKNIIEAFHHQFANIGEWIFGEAVGDIVAIPVTVALQRTAPEVMNAIRQPLEVLAKPFYKQAAEKQAQHWAKKHDVPVFSEEFDNYKQTQYESEMQKLPQAFVWTVVSMVAGAAAQKHLAPMMNPTWGNDGSYADIIAASVIGKTITAVAANAPRVAFPEATHEMDEFIRKHVATPTTQVIDSVRDIAHLGANSTEQDRSV
jgi:hypothetical protein